MRTRNSLTNELFKFNVELKNKDDRITLKVNDTRVLQKM